MLNHYFLLIYRNFLRSKSYFLINLVGLSTGLACTLLIYLWVRDELRMNTFHEKDATLYQVMEHQQYADEIMTTSSTPGLLADALKDEFPEIEFATTTSWVGKYTLSVKDHNIKAEGFHVGKDFFKIFSFPLIQGDPAQVMEDKLGMVISRELAKKLFGTDENVVGKMVELQHDKIFQVSGVFAGTPSNSSLQFDFVLSFEDFKDEADWVLEWGNNGPPTYITLKAGSDPKALEEKIKDYIKTKDKESNITLFLQRFSERYLYGSFQNGKQAGGRIEYVRLFSIIAGFILIIACINFMNLSTARASRKAKEVGIKKSIGAQRGSLIFQYLTESIMTAILSFVVACTVVWIFLPQFNLITGKQITLNWNDGELFLWFSVITILTGLIAGSYPALYLSGFKPAAILKGEMKGTWGELWARKGLVVFQFFLSVILIVSVLVIYQQIQFVQTKNIGYKKDHLILFPMEGKVETNQETFLEEIRRIPGVVSASTSSHGFLGRNSNTSGLQWEGKNPEDRILFENVAVNHGLLETMGIELSQGRFFSKDFATDTSKIIFNEAAIRVMNLKNPIGQKIKLWERHDITMAILAK